MHSAIFYRAFVFAYPAQLVLVRRISTRRWAARRPRRRLSRAVAAAGMVLPLFPAEQKLGPVFQRVPYMVPIGFPGADHRARLRARCAVAPAAAVECVGPGRALAGLVFLAVLVAVQWPFAEFLMSPWSRNWVFGTHYQMYMVDPAAPFARAEFFALRADARRVLARAWRSPPSPR